MLGRRNHTQAHNLRPAPHITRGLYRASFMLAILSGSLVWPVPTVAAAAPVTITTLAHAGTENGVSVYFAVATLSGGDDPTGTVTFRVFGPADHTCERPPTATSTNPVSGAGDPKRATSDRFVLRDQGVYHFVATYTGDARNAPAGPSACSDVNAAVGFSSSSIAFSAQASPSVPLGGTVFDTATVTASFAHAGTIAFDLFGPGATTCTETPAFTSSKPVRGNGSYTSDPFIPTVPGTYVWVARYSGDTRYPRTATSCADPAQQVEVRAANAASGGIQCTVRTQPIGGLAALLRDLLANPLAALLGRLNESTACRAGLPPG